MRFDENGRHVKESHITKHISDNVVVKLNSKHPGISQDVLNSVLQMVHNERINDFHMILNQMQTISI